MNSETQGQAQIKEGAEEARARTQGTPVGDRIAAIDALIRSNDFERISEFMKDQAAELQSRLQARGSSAKSDDTDA